MSSLDRYRTALACYEYEFERGEAKGHAKGLAEGMAKGAAEATLRNAKAMKALNLSASTIAQVTGLTMEDVEKL